MANNKSAYLTVYLTLCMSVLLSLCLTMIEGARQGGMRLHTECAADVSMNSIFAEYHRELFQKYNMFAIDCSYGTPYPDISNTEERIMYYLQKNVKGGGKPEELSDYICRDFFALSPGGVSIDEVLLLTDRKGAMFRRQAVEIIKEDCGIAQIEQVINWLTTVEENELTTRDIHSEKEELEESLWEYDGRTVLSAENQQELAFTILKIVNPTGKLEELRKRGLLTLLLNPEEKLSEAGLSEDTLLSVRMDSGQEMQGTLEMPDLSALEVLTEKILFCEYLVQYMGNYLTTKEDSQLKYQLEYLVGGLNNDLDNLSLMVTILVGIREVANTIYLFSDQEKVEEVKALVTTITAVLLIPELEPLFTPIVLMGWAFAESLCDVKALLSGERVPLLKSADSWNLGLQGALEADDFTKPQAESGDSDSVNKGLCYQDYLRILLCMVDKNILTKRAMNLVEADVRLTPGNAGFRLDGCIVGVKSTIHIYSGYGQDFFITRKRYY